MGPEMRLPGDLEDRVGNPLLCTDPILVAENAYREFLGSHRPMVLRRTDGMVLRVNGAFKKLLGFETHDFVGVEWKNLLVDASDKNSPFASYEGKLFAFSGAQIHVKIEEHALHTDHHGLVIKSTLENVTALQEAHLRQRIDSRWDERRVVVKKAKQIVDVGCTEAYNNNMLVLQLIDTDPKRAKEHARLTGEAILGVQSHTGDLSRVIEGEPPQKEVFIVEEVVRSSVDMILRGRKTQAVYYFAEDLWFCEADPSQIRTALQNIVLNSDEAQPEDNVVRVQAHNATFSEVEELKLPHGKYIAISIEDKGEGIDCIRESVIYGLTSTKRRDGGGLAECYTIIRNNGGLLLKEKAIETLFTLYLPARTRRPKKSREAAKRRTLQSQRILLLSEDPIYTEVVTGYFSKHHVAAVTTATEALKVLENAEVPYGVVLLDLSIRGGDDGLDVIAEVKNCRPRPLTIAYGPGIDRRKFELKSKGFLYALSSPVMNVLERMIENYF